VMEPGKPLRPYNEFRAQGAHFLESLENGHFMFEKYQYHIAIREHSRSKVRIALLSDIRILVIEGSSELAMRTIQNLHVARWSNVGSTTKDGVCTVALHFKDRKPQILGPPVICESILRIAGEDDKETLRLYNSMKVRWVAFRTQQQLEEALTKGRK